MQFLAKRSRKMEFKGKNSLKTAIQVNRGIISPLSTLCPQLGIKAVDFVWPIYG
jgi:hypothetical protein